RWPTTEFPTMPDPITTTFAVVGRSLTGGMLRRRSYEHLAEFARRVGNVRGDDVDVSGAGKAIARAVAMHRRDRRTGCIDDGRGDRGDPVVDFNSRIHVHVMPDRREPALDSAGLGHGGARGTRQRSVEIRGNR